MRILRPLAPIRCISTVAAIFLAAMLGFSSAAGSYESIEGDSDHIEWEETSVHRINDLSQMLTWLADPHGTLLLTTATCHV